MLSFVFGRPLKLQLFVTKSGKKAWHKDATAEPYGPPQNKPKVVNVIDSFADP